ARRRRRDGRVHGRWRHGRTRGQGAVPGTRGTGPVRARLFGKSWKLCQERGFPSQRGSPRVTSPRPYSLFRSLGTATTGNIAALRNVAFFGAFIPLRRP